MHYTADINLDQKLRVYFLFCVIKLNAVKLWILAISCTLRQD